MNALAYVTGNSFKFSQAVVTCKPFGVSLDQVELDIPEIQAKTGEVVARDKAAKAYAELKKPLVVSDDSWMIPGLNNFPGPYMKHMSEWLTVQDWINLTQSLTDRSIILRQIVIYQDEAEQYIFSVDIPGILLTESRGTSPYPHTTLVSFDGGKHTNAEYHEKGESAAAHHHNPWHEFAQWYSEKEDV
jgi:XTP/dITP diphosphohydrolase